TPSDPAPRGHRQQAADRQRTARPNQEIADAKLAKEIRDFDKAQFQLKQQKLFQWPLLWAKVSSGHLQFFNQMAQILPSGLETLRRSVVQ
ncbi:hypothetical protein PSTT_05852, partial [Puccinia striiformis]